MQNALFQATQIPHFSTVLKFETQMRLHDQGRPYLSISFFLPMHFCAPISLLSLCHLFIAATLYVINTRVCKTLKFGRILKWRRKCVSIMKMKEKGVICVVKIDLCASIESANHKGLCRCHLKGLPILMEGTELVIITVCEIMMYVLAAI